MSETLRVLGVLVVLGLVGHPLGALVLRRVPGAGAGLGRVIALLILTWLVWILGTAGVPNGFALAAGALFGVAVLGVGAFLIGRRRGNAEGEGEGHRMAIGAEAVFLLTFAAAVVWVGYSPDVWNTEKPMDMAFISATLASDQIPPHDPWMAGEELNYYYLGHLATGLLVRLSGVEPSAGYNLALAALLALSAAAAFGVGSAIARAGGAARPVLAGLAASALLLLVGTPRGGARALEHEGDLIRFDWFGPSRVIEDTINEFPFFSFLLGDLHAHVLAIPFTLLVVALALQIALHGPRAFLLTALAVGFLYGVNSWSWPLGLLLVGSGLVVWARRPAGGSWKGPLLWGAGVAVGGLVLIAPFLIGFDPNAKGIGLVRQREGLGEFLAHHAVIYGALGWLLVAMYVRRFLDSRSKLRVLAFGSAALAVLLPLMAGADLAGAVVLLALLAVAVHAVLAPGELEPARRFMWALVAGALACLVIPEIVYVRDEFDGGELFRMNTVFKLGYQAWILLAIAGACALAWGRDWLPWPARWAWRGVALALVILSCAYTVAGSVARKNGFAGDPASEGRNWLARTAPGDIGAIDWLRENAPGDAVVLEATGDDYSAFGHARISTFTGRPTVMGWAGHELQWSHDPGARRDEVRTMYTSLSETAIRPMLDRYAVRYVVVGPIERTDYGEAGIAKWERIGKTVFDAEGTTVFDLGPVEEPPKPGGGRTRPVLG